MWFNIYYIDGIVTKAEWNLPTGPHLDRALKIQCCQLFMHWRYRLKEHHFVGTSQTEALDNRPPEVKLHGDGW